MVVKWKEKIGDFFLPLHNHRVKEHIPSHEQFGVTHSTRHYSDVLHLSKTVAESVNLLFDILATDSVV